MNDYVIDDKVNVVTRANIKDATIYHSLHWQRKGNSASYRIAYRRNVNHASQTRRQRLTSKPARDYGEIHYFLLPNDFNRESNSTKLLIAVVQAYKILKWNMFTKLMSNMKNSKLKAMVREPSISDTFRLAEKSTRLELVYCVDILHKVVTINSNFDDNQTFFLSEIDYVVQKA